MKKEAPYKKLLISSIGWLVVAVDLIWLVYFCWTIKDLHNGTGRPIEYFVCIVGLIYASWRSYTDIKENYNIRVKCYEFIRTDPAVTVEDLTRKIYAYYNMDAKNLALNNKKTIVRTTLKKMIRQGFFPGAYFDEAADRAVFPGAPAPVQPAAAPEASAPEKDYVFCGMCGAKISAVQRFCTHCGAEISAPDAATRCGH